MLSRLVAISELSSTLSLLTRALEDAYLWEVNEGPLAIEGIDWQDRRMDWAAYGKAMTAGVDELLIRTVISPDIMGDVIDNVRSLRDLVLKYQIELLGVCEDFTYAQS